MVYVSEKPHQKSSSKGAADDWSGRNAEGYSLLFGLNHCG
jgi:hypothetical protein